MVVEASEERLAAEWKRAVQRDYNHPCVVAWVPVNESMGFPGLGREHPGQYAFIERMVAMTRRLDPRRPVIDNDGWEHTDITDICAIHDYTPTAELLRERYRETAGGGALPAHVWIGERPLFVLGSRYRGQPVMLTEVGGFLMIPPDVPPEDRDMLYKFYGSVGTREELLEKYRDLMDGIASLAVPRGLLLHAAHRHRAGDQRAAHLPARAQSPAREGRGDSPHALPIGRRPVSGA